MMFEKLKNELDVSEIRQEQTFNREDFENKLLYNNYLNNIQNIILPR